MSTSSDAVLKRSADAYTERGKTYNPHLDYFDLSVPWLVRWQAREEHAAGAANRANTIDGLVEPVLSHVAESAGISPFRSVFEESLGTTITYRLSHPERLLGVIEPNVRVDSHYMGTKKHTIVRSVSTELVIKQQELADELGIISKGLRMHSYTFLRTWKILCAALDYIAEGYVPLLQKGLSASG